MAKSADDPRTFISQVSLVGRGSGAVKTLVGFKKAHHTVPDAVNAATSRFLAQLCAVELAAEAEWVFQRARTEMGYKRTAISLDVTSPAAVLTAKDFTLEIVYALNEADAASYEVTRTLHSLRSGDVVRTAEFDALFAGQFSAIAFALKKAVRVEAVIDAVEGLDEDAALRARITQALAAEGLAWSGAIEVEHVLPVLAREIGVDALAAGVRAPRTMANAAALAK